MDLDIIVKSGAWYAYEGNKIGQGRENAKQYLKEHEDVCMAVDTKVREHYGFGDSRAKKLEGAERSLLKSETKGKGKGAKAAAKAEERAAAGEEEA